MRQDVVRRARNNRRKVAYKTAVKEFKKAIQAKEFDTAKELLTKVYQSLDKAAKANSIKKNKASRLKSRLSLHLKPVK